ncbi:immunoglobulin-like domain-containing protein [Agromyces laixinhei]|uniref:immunoglobulin-like domain-containing protein n=1 Tax=Agromyces laixinhei TaxID=2585717 RepID=UPI001116F744|nr:immunoglobulin-like domain-containing protein [Agromyces laixinhei]
MRPLSTTSANAPRRRSTRPALASSVVAALAVSLLGSAPLAANAAEVPAPTAHYDMSHEGSTLLDVSGNGRDATLTGLTDESFVTAGGGDVLRFKADGYAALPQGLVTAADNSFTVEYTVSTQTAANHFGWVIGAGVGPWDTTQLGNHIFLSPRSSQGGYSNQVLAAIRVKSGAGNGETRMPAGGGLNPGFTTLTMVGSGNTLTLYRDGVVISTVTHTRSLSSIIPSGDVLGYLGRSLYQGDPLLRADVSDVKFWDVALTADDVSASMPTAAEKTAATEGLIRGDILAAMLGANPSLDAVSSTLTLPASVNGITLAWSSSDEAVISTTGAVSRSITEDTPVTLTVTTSLGSTLTFDATVLAPSVSADLDAIALDERTTENLPLATTGTVNGAAITWTSSDPALVTSTDAAYAAPSVGSADPFAGGGLVTRPAYGEGDREVTLIASATLNGQTAERTFEVTVAEHGRSAPDAGYAAAYFKSDGDEKIYQAATTGNDFFTFETVNGGNPVITSTADTTGLRDPYILRSQNGDKYYMIATDLCISCGTGWGPAQSAGSLKINVWESTDLVHWERTNGENSGISVNQPEAGMTWAPEAYWDDELQSYVVHFSSRLYADASHTNSDNLHARVFTVLTRDFTTFTYPPTEWQNTGYARIDSTIEKIGDYYYRFTKNEEGGAADGLEAGKDIFLERSKVLTAPTTGSDWNADPETTWQLTDTNMTRLETNQVGEGPQIIKLNEGDPSNTADDDGYVFLVDNFSAGGYRAFVTSGDEIASSTQTDRLSKRADWNVRPVGGLPASPRHGSFVSVSQSVLTAMHDWTSVAAVSSSTTLAADGRTVTAEVSAADGGQVAGAVTFTGGSWSEMVHLVDGTASVAVPADVDAVIASYDGYVDGLVSPSVSTEIELEAGLALAASATTRCVAGKVYEVVTVRNADDATATVTITTAYGTKTISVTPGKGVSSSFATRSASIDGDSASIEGESADGRSHRSQVSVAAAGCG